MRFSRSSRGGGRHARARNVRRAAVCAIVTVLLFLLTAATAQAYRPGDRIWLRTIGTTAKWAGAWDVATGPNGVVCIGGWTDAAGSPEGVALVVKYNATGAKKWSRTYKGLGSAEVESVAFDANGNVYASGETWNAGAENIFVAKYTAAGVRKWLKTYDGKGLDDWSEAIAVGRVGNVYVAGHSKVTASLEGIVVLKYNTLGTRKWARRIDPDLLDANQGSREVSEMRIDTAGNVYVAGAAREGGAPDYDVYSALVAKLAAGNGAVQWGGPKYYKGSDGTGAVAYGIAVRGNAVVAVGEASKWTGHFMDLLVMRYDLAGNEVHPPLEYTRDPAADTSDDWADDVAIDKNGNAFVTGGFSQQPDDYPSALALLKVTPTGAVAWPAKAYLPATGYAYAEGWYVRVDSYNNAYVGGIVGVDDSGHDRFLTVKYSSGGVKRWAKVWPPAGVGFNEPGGLALGTTGGVYIAGEGNPGGNYYQAVLIKYQR